MRIYDFNKLGDNLWVLAHFSSARVSHVKLKERNHLETVQTERLEMVFTRLNGERVEEVLRGDEEADHVALAAVPAHAEVLHRGVGQEAALHLDSTSWHNNLLLATLSLVHHLAQADVLAALQLDQVLLAVDDLDGAVRAHVTHVPGAEPPPAVLLEELLLGLVRHLVVLLGHVAAAHQDLAPRPLRVGHGVAALLPVDQPQVHLLRCNSR